MQLSTYKGLEAEVLDPGNQQHEKWRVGFHGGAAPLFCFQLS